MLPLSATHVRVRIRVCAYVYALRVCHAYAYTRCKPPTRMPRIGREEIFSKRIRKGRERAPRLRIRPLSSSLYIQPYDRLPYKDLYTALSMLTHRWNIYPSKRSPGATAVHSFARFWTSNSQFDATRFLFLSYSFVHRSFARRVFPERNFS